MQVLTEKAIAKYYGVYKKKNIMFPEGFVEMKSGFYRAFEVKNQVWAGAGHAVQKFQEIYKRSVGKDGWSRFARFDLYINVKSKLEINYGINKKGFLTFLGEEVRIGNLPIRVHYRELGLD